MTRDALHTSILSTLALAEAEACPAFPHNDIAAYVHVGSALHEADAFPSAYTYLLKNNLIRAKQDRYALVSHAHAFHMIPEREAASVKKIACNTIPLLLLQTIPFAHTMAITGSVAMNNATSKSDVDIFCIARHGRLWTVRALSLALAALFLRRRDNTVTGEKLCFNYFLAHDAEAPVQNIASAHMFARALPLFDHDAFARFFTQNKWIARHLRYPEKQSRFPRVAILRMISKIIAVPLSGAFGDRIEQRLKAWQMRRLKQKIREGGDTLHFILRDDAILLHYPHSKNKAVMDRYERRIRALSITHPSC